MDRITENIYDPEFVKLLFNSMSASYERMNYISSFGFCIIWRRQALAHCAPKENPAVLDLLAGMGETWHSIMKKFPSARITALDFSEEMVRAAQQRNKKHFGGKVELLEQNILQNQLKDDAYDVVVCAYGLKTFSEQQLHIIASELKRILKPGGAFSFVDVSSPPNPILRWLYAFYLGKLIPLLGKAFLGNPEAYRMLWHYTSRFRNAQAAVAIFRNAGLICSYRSYFFGCATGFYGKK